MVIIFVRTGKIFVIPEFWSGLTRGLFSTGKGYAMGEHPGGASGQRKADKFIRVWAEVGALGSFLRFKFRIYFPIQL
jgi:hypothetical protein